MDNCKKRTVKELQERNGFLVIENADLMPPFFINLVSSANHWMFLSSNGGVTAGRIDANHAFFPYYTDDKIANSHEETGSKTLVRLSRDGQLTVWEPFSERSEALFSLRRNLYKSVYGNEMIFEEINDDLQLAFRYQWSSSDRYGFVRTATLTNLADREVSVELIDGLHNIMPYGVPSDLQQSTSNLVDAYKRSELEPASGVGIFALSAIIIDRAEPSEALKANVAWAVGLEGAKHLLSDHQLDAFRRGETVTEETDNKGARGAYLLNAELMLAAGASEEWIIVADVNQTQSDVVKLATETVKAANVRDLLRQDIADGTETLIRLAGSADGLQQTADRQKDIRHFSNTLFNIMRGGIFDHNYDITKQDFTKYIKGCSRRVWERQQSRIEALPGVFSLEALRQQAQASGDADFSRLALEYLPLFFSRRHGDPSRPWNKFTINTADPLTKERILDYQGNWRDIFQNWEALAVSYPEFLESMIHKFLNATTFEGYNPYRVVKLGFDWETADPTDPWSYIGYWGDHQIIYLLKLLETLNNHSENIIARQLAEADFVFANVPYKIKSFADIVKNPKDTIVFDDALDAKIKAEREHEGSDAALLKDGKGELVRATLLEKLLIPVLAKLSNYVADGGIWMNTQRPEWNDANNALVGNGLSMVTLYYLRRFLHFFDEILSQAEVSAVDVADETARWFTQTADVFRSFDGKTIDNQARRSFTGSLGTIASDYREQIYNGGFSGKKAQLSVADLRAFVAVVLRSIDASIRGNKRDDNLYHAYNLIGKMDDNALAVDHLSEMLEGQVAVLSSGALSAQEVLTLLEALRHSALYREDQNSYILYPNKQLPGFLQKNIIAPEAVAKSKALQQMVTAGDKRIVEQDVQGQYHFNGDFRNAGDLQAALLKTYLTATDQQQLLDIFEQTFNHKAFTGRSGTFYAYEGLGSIYWHMVSKLAVAVMECSQQAEQQGESKETVEALTAHYYDICDGIGVHKSPTQYGAFPTDAYSHTPAGKGAKQPGMTGQVKEDILCRFAELGVSVEHGQMVFEPFMLKADDLQREAFTYYYIDVDGQKQQLNVPANSLAFTYCQVPVVYTRGQENSIRVTTNLDETVEICGKTLSQELSHAVFSRSGEVKLLEVTIAA